MKNVFSLILTGCLAAGAALAQSPVTVIVDTQVRSYAVAPDFAGVSIFTGTQVRDHRGIPGNLFSGTNTQLITLFENAGIHHLRLGATGSPDSGTENLSHNDIDSLFAFAQATGIKVIYSLHYADGPATAKYIWDHYQASLDCFAFDNEPDGRLNDGPEQKAAGKTDYFTSWRDFAKSVTDAVPGAKFAGPDAAGRTLVRRFVKTEQETGALALVTQHFYVGGNPVKKHIDTSHGIANILSEDWVTNLYPLLYKSVLRPLAKDNLPYRLTEFDDHVHGVTNASETFVTALWALDGMHWWAAHGAQGVNFQNTEWLRTDTFYIDADGNYQMHPKACGIRAFNEGSHGSVEAVTVTNADGLNLTAYAIGDATNLYVTIINKEYGANARAATVNIQPKDFSPGKVEAMYLTAANGDVQATNGVTIGSAAIVNHAAWDGKWTALNAPANGQCIVAVPATSAAVVRISALR